MKPKHNLSLCYAGIICILALSVFFAGCTSSQAPAGAPAGTPAPTTSQASLAPLQTTIAPMIIANLPYGVIMSYPNSWERKDVLTSGVRDYGQNTVNIATFFSPNEIPGDSLSYNSLSVDVDQNVQQDFDTYFNQATIALGKTYGTQMQAHSTTLKIGGYDSYELDFQSSDVKGSYIFTNAGGSIYIFAFKGTTKPIAVHALQSEIVDMYKSIQLTPPVTVAPKQR
jgi:hypothetical protein